MIYKYISKNLQPTAMLLWLVLFACGCKNDIEVIQPAAPRTIVYGILNSADSIQYIRIHKSFVGEGDALQMAQIADSTYFKNALDVKIEEYNSANKKVNEFTCMPDSSIVKDTGIFASLPNVLYRTQNGYALSEKNTYKLVINNKSNGEQSTATTGVIGKLPIGKPQAGPVNFLDKPFSIQFYTIQNAKIYEVVVRFHYFEQDINNPQIIASKYFDWRVGYENRSPDRPLELVTVNIGPEDFFRTAASKITVNTNVKRLVGNVEFIFTAGSEELYSYYTIHNSTSSLTQSIPSFSNIENGTGLYTTRRRDVLVRTLDGASVAELKNGVFTKNLGF